MTTGDIWRGEKNPGQKISKNCACVNIRTVHFIISRRNTAAKCVHMSSLMMALTSVLKSNCLKSQVSFLEHWSSIL